MSRPTRIAVRTAVAVAILLIAGFIAAVLIFRSGWFHQQVRARVIFEIEKSTGGRVELGNFTLDWEHQMVTLGPLILHGTEPAGDPPLLTVRSATLGLHIISMLERKVDLASVRVEQPAVHIVFYGDGRTNLPSPRVHDEKSWAQDLINIKIAKYEVVDGLLEYDNRVIPLTFRGEDLRVKMDYEALRARYRGSLAFQRARITAKGFGPLELNIASTFTFDTSRIEISQLRITSGDSHADLTGVLTDVRSPRGTMNVKAAVSVRDATAMLQLPSKSTGVAQSGKAAFDGQLAIALEHASDFTLAGRLNAQSIGYSYERIKINGADLQANLSLTADQLTLNQLKVHANDTTITGTAALTHRRDFHFDGAFEGLTIADAAGMATNRRIPWNGNLAGSVTADAVLGQATAKVQASVQVTPASLTTGIPVQGQSDIFYDQAAGTIRIEGAHVATAATSVDTSGVLGGTLNVHAQSSNLDDLLPAIEMIDETAPKQLPVKLNHGNAEFRGTITGPFDDPHARGQVTVSNAIVEGHQLDRFSANLDATSIEVHLDQLMVTRGATQVDGSASIAARNGSYDDAAIFAQVNVRNAQLAELAKESKIDTPISGMANATVHVSGSVRRPEAEIVAQIDQPMGFGEHGERLRANVRYSAERVEVSAGDASVYGGTIRFEGAFQHKADDWKNGTIRFDVAAQNLTLGRIEHLAKLSPSIDGMAAGKATGSARLVNNEFILDSLNGDASGRGLISDQQPLGDVTLNAETRGADLAVRGSAKLRDLTVDAQGSWKIAGDSRGSVTVRFSRASVATLQSVIMAGGPLGDTVLPFDGFVDGARANVTFSLSKPRDFSAELTIDQVQLDPKAAHTLRLGVQAQDVVVKNSKPVVIEITSKEARIRSAEFTARDTSLEVAGAVPFDAPTTSAGLTVRGSVNLSVLQLLNPDLAARGNATVQASIRGSLKDPQVSGRMELKNASLYLSDLPNGVDNANGAINFDRNRATIEKLTAETGGGVVNFTGFIGFGSTLMYRLQAVAEKVRVRYPEDVSVTLNATIAMNGTSDASTVSGSMTMTRAAFTPRADFAQVLAQAARPVSAPIAASEYVRGMQFDVRIQSGPNFEFQTSLARNLEAEVDLRLRGTPLRPVLIGSVSVSEGEVQMFGNRYTVNRGDIRFANQVKVDPIFDMELETKVRGVTVNIAISGTTQKLNVNYSSDPPMQPRDIIALLAVGRSPGDSAGLNATPSTAGSTNLNEAGGSLISQAISAQLSSRLQRFFGASRVKIDPTVNSVEYLPEARLTIEQQVSQAITLTYITNLNRTEEQIVQVEWDFSKQWSAVAVREASGLFGIDFQFRKRFN